jgi:Nif-specific regulatory protein
VPILLPPLRERGAQDTTRLAEHFLSVFENKHQRGVLGFSEAAMQRLLDHTWPGNIRELENCIESAVVLAEGEWIEAHHLALPESTGGSPRDTPKKTLDLTRTLAEVELEYIDAVLTDCGGNQSEAARRLGVSRNTLARKLKG